jgi:site-specific recombinase
MPHFTYTPEEAATQIIYFAIAGIVLALSGVIVQFFINRKLSELRKQEIIEVI